MGEGHGCGGGENHGEEEREGAPWYPPWEILSKPHAALLYNATLELSRFKAL